MSLWEVHQIEEKIRAILSDVEYYDPDHHFGRPFFTAYQLAIELEKRYPPVVAAIGYPIGGKGVGVKSSFSQYLARELSKKLNPMTFAV